MNVARYDYRRGWNTSARACDGSLERADMRGESDEWYDGYFDYAVGRPKYHTLDCNGIDCQEAEHPIRANRTELDATDEHDTAVKSD